MGYKNIDHEDTETFWAYLKYMWREERWFYYLAFIFSLCMGLFTFFLLLAVQR